MRIPVIYCLWKILKVRVHSRIEAKMSEAEAAGADGNVNLAQSLVLEADKLREEEKAAMVSVFSGTRVY